MSYRITAEAMFEDFKEQFPLMSENAIEYGLTDQMEITVWFSDGKKAIYNYLRKTVRMLHCKRSYESERPSEEDWKNDFSIILKKRMDARHIKQKELSEYTGISQQIISRYLNGKSTPTAYNLMLIAKSLGCSPTELTIFDF